MKKINHHAITLTELIVATTIMGIILLGIVSLDVAVRQTQQVSEKSAKVVMDVSAAITHILNNATLAVGYQADQGIQVINDGSFYGLYIRQDTSNTPANYADDTWLRYLGATGDPTTHHDILFCSSVSGPADTAACGGTEYPLIHVSSINYTLTPPYLEVTVISRHDPTTAVNPMKNPSYTLTSRITPPGHTW
ncbi:MAG: hypothetical protein WC552_04740 [Candidatus Omnitrophota bacterium]